MIRTVLGVALCWLAIQVAYTADETLDYIQAACAFIGGLFAIAVGYAAEVRYARSQR